MALGVVQLPSSDGRIRLGAAALKRRTGDALVWRDRHRLCRSAHRKCCSASIYKDSHVPTMAWLGHTTHLHRRLGVVSAKLLFAVVSSQRGPLVCLDSASTRALKQGEQAPQKKRSSGFSGSTKQGRRRETWCAGAASWKRLFTTGSPRLAAWLCQRPGG